MKKLKFKIELLAASRSGKAGYFVIPYSIPEIWKIKKMVKVKAKINNYIHRGLLMPDGKGNHFFGIRSSIMKELGAKVGDVVKIEMEIDTEERIVEVPEYFTNALNKNKSAKEKFEKLSYSHRKEYVQWITSAKKEETRNIRINKAMVMLGKM